MPWLCAGQAASDLFLAATNDESITYVSAEVPTPGKSPESSIAAQLLGDLKALG